MIARKQLFDCLSCDCYVAHDAKQPARGGICHGAPPTASVVGARPHPITQQPEAVTQSFYSSVGPGDWCAVHPMFEIMRGQRPHLIGEAVQIDGNGKAPTPAVLNEVAELEDDIVLPGEVKPAANDSGKSS